MARAEVGIDVEAQPRPEVTVDAPMPSRRRAARRAALIAVVGVVIAVGTATAIGKAAGYAALVDRLEDAQLWWLPLLVVGQVLAYAGYTLAYQAMARVDGGPQLPLMMTARIVGASFGAYAIASGLGALGVDYWALRRAGADHHGAFSRVIAFKTVEWAVLSVAVVASSLALLLGAGAEVSTPAAVTWLLVVPTCWVLAWWFTSPSRHAAVVADPRSRARRLFADTIGAVVLVRHVVGHPRAQWRALAGTILYWAGDVLTLWAGLRAFDVQLSLAEVTFGYATGYVVTMLPLPAGGVGGVDAGMTYALTLVGVPLGGALLGVFAYRFFSFWLPLVPGILTSATIKPLSDRLPSVAFPAAGRPQAIAPAASPRSTR